MGIEDVINGFFGGGARGRTVRRPDGEDLPAFIAPMMKPSKKNDNRILFQAATLFTGGQFRFYDFRLRIKSDDTIQLQTNIEFGKLVTGYQVAPSPIVAFAFADSDRFFMEEKWIIDSFAKRCSDSTRRSFRQKTKISGVFANTKQLGALHTGWGYKYC